MACRPVPVSEVVTGSTPVVAFGDPRNASVATLGINPSWHEFLADDGSLLSGSKRRLATLTSLNAKDTALLDLNQARTVFEDCAAYFQPDRNPYRRWFDPLDQVLRAAFGVSYYAGTECHLDLVQWATTPVWSELSRSTKGVLVREGLPYLRRLLSLGSIRIVLLNGRQVIEQIKASRLFELEVCGNLAVKRHSGPRRSSHGSSVLKRARRRADGGLNADTKRAAVEGNMSGTRRREAPTRRGTFCPTDETVN
jgi:hypothetical protein